MYNNRLLWVAPDGVYLPPYHNSILQSLVGFFVNEKDFQDLSKKDKQVYYKKKDELSSQSKIKKKEPSAKNDRKRFIKNVLQIIDEVDKESNETEDAATTNDEDKGDGNNRMTRVLNLLNSRKINTTTTARPVKFRVFNVPSDKGYCNTFGDSGSDTCLAGHGFTFTSYTDRKALVQSFDSELSIGEKNWYLC